MSIIIFILILALLIFVHELGHFLAAKWTGMRVDEFAIGFKPALYQKRIGETNYVLGVIPIGGYVKIHGENYDDAQLDDPRAFASKPHWAQAVVLVAGVVMNFLLAWLIYVGMFMAGPTVPQSAYPDVTLADRQVQVLQVLEDSAADQAGIQAGDQIVAVDGLAAGYTAADLRSYIADQDQIQLTLQHADGVQETISVTPSYNAEHDRKIAGVGLDDIGTASFGLFEAIGYGTARTVDMTWRIFAGVGDLLSALMVGDKATLSQVAGPVGIAGIVGQASQTGWQSLLGITALLSLNLMILNILPFPALDGGRLVMVAAEVISRRKIPVAVAGWINLGGFAVLILLMLVVTVGDIGRLL